MKKLSLPAAIDSILANYTITEKGDLSGVLQLRYQGQDKQHITKVLNTILAVYSQHNITRRSTDTARTLAFLDEQLPDLRKQLDNAEFAFNRFRQKYNTVDITRESELYLNQSVNLESQRALLEQRQAEIGAMQLLIQPCVKLRPNFA